MPNTISESHKKAISVANKGRVFSEEHREKLRQAKLGKLMSNEHKSAISSALKGKMPSFIPNPTGLKRTKENKRKISATLKEKYQKGEIKIPSQKGKINPNAKIHQPGYHAFLVKRRNTRKKTNGGSHTFEQWENLKKQYNYTCPCCLKSEPAIKLTVDHILPISKGGGDNIENIQPLCGLCNRKKGTKHIKYVFKSTDTR